MRKFRFFITGLFLLLSLNFSTLVWARETGGADPGTPNQANVAGRCALIDQAIENNKDDSAEAEGGGAQEAGNAESEEGGTQVITGVDVTVYEKYPACANSENECFSNEHGIHPINCFFLTEPIGGKTGYDLYKRVKKVNSTGQAPQSGAQDESDPCDLVIQKTGDFQEDLALQEQAQKACDDYKAQQQAEEKEEIVGEDEEGGESGEGGNESGTGSDALAASGEVSYSYELWYGEFLIPGVEFGPVQAILIYEPGQPEALNLAFNYVDIAMDFFTPVLIGLVILILIVGGVLMIVSGGNTELFDKGKKYIINALIGMGLWFLIPYILNFLNPNFFRF